MEISKNHVKIFKMDMRLRLNIEHDELGFGKTHFK